MRGRFQGRVKSSPRPEHEDRENIDSSKGRRMSASVPDSHPAVPWPPSTPIIAVLTFTAVVIVGQMYSVLAILPVIAESLRIGPSEATGTATVFGVAYAAGFLIAGPLASKHGSRRVMVAGLGAAALATAVAGVPTNLPWELVARAAQGGTAATFAPAAFTYVAEHLVPRRRPLALTCLTSAFLASAVLLQLFAQLIEQVFTWRMVFVFSAIALAACAVAVVALVPDRPSTQPSPDTHPFRAIPRVLARGRMLALYGSAATLLGGYAGVFTTISLVGPSDIIADPQTLQTLRLGTLPALIMVPLLGKVLHRWGAGVRGSGSLALAAVFAVAASALDGSTIALGFSVFLFIAAIAAAAPAIIEAVVAIARPGESGGATALYGFFMFLGGSAGPQIASLLAPSGFVWGMSDGAPDRCRPNVLRLSIAPSNPPR
jgi:predicted MFS family arabinose efflux permease